MTVIQSLKIDKEFFSASVLLKDNAISQILLGIQKRLSTNLVNINEYTEM